MTEKAPYNPACLLDSCLAPSRCGAARVARVPFEGTGATESRWICERGHANLVVQRAVVRQEVGRWAAAVGTRAVGH